MGGFVTVSQKDSLFTPLIMDNQITRIKKKHFLALEHFSDGLFYGIIGRGQCISCDSMSMRTLQLQLT